MSQPYTLHRPDWVVFGARLSDGQVMVLASDSVSHIDLRAAYEMRSPGDWARYGAGGEPLSVEINGVMSAARMVVSADYASALRSLFEQWQPGTPAEQLQRWRDGTSRKELHQ